MKVKVSVLREEEIEIESAALNYLIDISNEDDYNILATQDLINEAVEDIEKIVGLPFGDSKTNETICAVYTMDNQTILEW